METYRFATHSLRSLPWGERLAHILAAGISAVEPGSAVARYLRRDRDHLELGGQPGLPPTRFPLSRFRRVFLVGAGKAGAPMARSAAGIIGERLAGGLIIVKKGYAKEISLPETVSVFEAGHPVPDETGVQATARIADLLARTQPDDLVVCLISGGGSALLTSPVPGISLQDLQALTSALLACGANIEEINTLRKHLDIVKGGGLARLASPATVITLILSDVVGSPLDVIASGPTVPDPTTFADACAVLSGYKILAQVPASILAHLQRGLRGQVPDTPKPGDPLFESIYNRVVGSNLQAAQAALEQAEKEGFHTLLLTTYLQGEARQAGRLLAAIARQIEATGQPLPRPACIIAGGETTVTIQGDGLGGRNQELALAAVAELAGLQDVALVTLATDGGDGPTDAAGAVVTGETLERARQAGLDPQAYLARNDSYHFFQALDDLLKPGPTQTNVNDLAFLFAF